MWAIQRIWRWCRTSCWPRLTAGWRHGQRYLLIGCAMGLLAGCAAPGLRLNPLPAALETQAEIPGIPGARYWSDEKPDGFGRWLGLPEAELRARYGGIMDRPHNYLVISGGGEDGAFGAGLLVGWSAAGTRPEFQVVTGVSTGALIAPFAFLGPSYDKQLQEVYTRYSSADLIEVRNIFSILSGDAAADTVPLQRLLERYVDDQVVAAIAAEGRRGRSLLVGTTNLDAGRPVTWDLTRIAASGSPAAKRLIHQVILASASIPGAFPPVVIDVEANGRRFQELHVDGGVTSQLFLSPSGIDWQMVAERLRVDGKPQLYVIRNAKLTPTWESVPQRVLPILARTVSTLIRTQGVGDLAQIYLLAKRDGLGYNLAWIPLNFSDTPQKAFDRDYMRRLFTLGYDLAAKGYPWLREAVQ
jgi:hypothetical protein